MVGDRRDGREVEGTDGTVYIPGPLTAYTDRGSLRWAEVDDNEGGTEFGEYFCAACACFPKALRLERRGPL